MRNKKNYCSTFIMGLIHVFIIGAGLGLTSGVGLLPHDSVNAAVGDTVMFTTLPDPAQAPFVSISWQFASRNIITSAASNTTGPEYEGRITLFMSTGSLELRNVTLNDSGEYNVTIKSADGSLMNGLTTLNVSEMISAAQVTSSTQKPAEGTSLNLTCDASGSIFTREWMKNGLPLKPSENIVFYDQNQVLSIRVLNRKDSGRYTCNISNPISSQEATYYMVVIYGPEDVQISGPKEVQEKTMIKLSCSADSVPAASYIWIKNGTTIAHSSEYTKNITGYSDSGDYICRATNDITMNTSEASHTVLVTEAPTDSLSAGAIAGITAACLVVVAAAVGGGVYIYKHQDGKRQNNNSLEDRHASQNTSKTSNFYTEEENKHVYDNSSMIYDRNL